jgi:hypothetical protein
MNDDELLIAFRSNVSLPDEETTRRAYERATHSRRRLVTRRRLVIAAAVAGAAAIAGGLSATFVGASSDVNPQRQQIVDATVTQVQQALGDERTFKATLDGSLLTVSASANGEGDRAAAGIEELVLAYVADQNLRAAGDEGIATVSYSDGEFALAPISVPHTLPDDACDIPPSTKLANVTAASGRIVKLLGGFCIVHLTTGDPKKFAGEVETTLNQLYAAVPPAKPSQGRAVIIEADDPSGSPVIAGAWGPGTVLGGAVYVRPGLCTPLVTPPITVGGKSRC